MKYLACSILFLALSGCTEKGSEPGTESETSETSGTKEPDTTTTTTGDDPSTTTTTSETTPTSTGEPDETTGTESSGTTAPPIDEDCAFLIGKSFVSKKAFPCGPPPDPDMPDESCPDHVSFNADSFDYQSGDYGVSGTYTCEGGAIAGEAEGLKYQGTIDAAAAELVWEGEQFEVE